MHRARAHVHIAKVQSEWGNLELGQASFFLCFSLCARIDFRQSAEKKKKVLSGFLRGIPTQSLRVRTGTVDRPLHSIQNP